MSDDAKIVKHLVVTPGTNFLGMLTVAFISLKLAKFIDWSWWFVLAPSLLPAVIMLSFFTLVVLVDYISNKKKGYK